LISGTTLGSFIKALVAGEESGGKYKDFKVLILPPNAAAGNSRSGACTTMATVLCIEQVIAVSGHTMAFISALASYLRIELPFKIPGTLVLAGWPAPPWGQTCKGAQPASLSVLIDSGVDKTALQSREQRDQQPLFSLTALAPPASWSAPQKPQSSAGFAPWWSAASPR